MTVTIGSDTFEVYGSTSGLASYANGSLLYADTHSAATAMQRARALVEATKLMDRQRWQGSKTVSGQALAWPRDGVVDADGEDVDSSTVPTSVTDATYELALAALADPSILSATSTGSNVQSVGAGAASVSFFAPVRGARFPARVMELVGWALASAASSATTSTSLASTGASGSFVSGTDGLSDFDSCDTYGRTGGG